ncbi:hypothetical protein BaRGS_00010200 [Batillaria attramentaria]|uniref:Uncharacterized protein n=1 Tax=Batillaria attramentaria TaxID=370345 RepID=A0ABD0LGJ1_9CAEN
MVCSSGVSSPILHGASRLKTGERPFEPVWLPRQRCMTPIKGSVCRSKCLAGRQGLDVLSFERPQLAIFLPQSLIQCPRFLETVFRQKR